MMVLHPADAEETIAMTRFVAELPHPVYLRLGRAGVPTVFEEGTKFEVGKVRVLTEGEISSFATGPLVAEYPYRSKKLEDDISVKVINVSCLSPLDTAGVLRAIREFQK